jgi:hypothetical protein
MSLMKRRIQESTGLSLSVLLIGLVLSTVFIAVITTHVSYDNRSYPAKKALPDLESNTPRFQSDQVAIMNILNRFQMDEENLPKDLDEDQRKLRRLQHFKRVRGSLAALQAEGTLEEAQFDLIRIFSNWEDLLLTNEDTYLLRGEFISIGKSYPWLNTLAWLIVLNRL